MSNASSEAPECARNNSRSVVRLVPALLCALPVWLGLAGPAAAEPALQLAVARAPYYVGAPIELQVQSEDFERSPEPECSAGATATGQLRLLRVVPSFSSSVQIINGRMSKKEVSTFTCVWEFTATQPGSYRLGPFFMEQNGEKGRSQQFALKVAVVPKDPRIKLRIGLPDGPVYLGQRVLMAIEFWLDEALQDSVRGYVIRSELFDREEVFHFVGDATPDRGEQTLNIQTAAGELILPAVVQRRKSGRRKYLVVMAERTLMPLREGEFELAPATLEATEVTRWQRDLFGARRPAETRRIFAQGEAHRLVVKAPPDRNRPPSFAGAVGRGFSLEVTADRSVVQLGDPITLTLTIRGDGNLANVALPRLEGEHGFSPAQFRLPDGDVAGEVVGDAKVFKLPVRVLDDAVQEVPALHYSWFDPELGRYETSESRPIALSVRPAQMISASDVVSGTSKPAASPLRSGAGDEHANTGREEDPRIRSSFSLTGADLSIEEDSDKLIAARDDRSGLRAAAYGGSILALALALGARRRAQIDPQIRRQRAVYQTQRKRIEAARSLPRIEALSEMAAAVREIAAQLPESRSPAVERFLTECDAVIYAPDATTHETLEPELASLADALLDEMQETLR
ncbi:MAG: BatD family protein [Deltaproteobacteria bacterium]|nr:BatD family protein [Deltaproteobacteria bacterium]MBW2384869.1 BatD family protein [Deltaproteobacteria bacterium]